MLCASRLAISTLMVVTLAGAARASSEDEIKALFTKFVEAQNAHDLKAIGNLLQDSPNFLWIALGTPIWGRDAALRRFEALYQGLGLSMQKQMSFGLSNCSLVLRRSTSQ